MKRVTTLINRACSLNVEIKASKKQLDSDKEALVDLYIDGKAGKIQKGSHGCQVTFSESDQFEKIEVASLLETLTAQGKEEELFDCLAVNMAALRKVLGQGDIDKLLGDAVGVKYSVRLKIVEEV